MVYGELPERYLVCIDEYLKGKSKTDAMLIAGYSEGTARGRGPMLVFGREDVKAEIAKRQKGARVKYDIDRDWVVQRLAAIADAPAVLAKFKKINSDGTLYYDFTGATEAELELVDSITTETYMEGRGDDAREIRKFKITVNDRQRALDGLARIFGFNKDSLDVKGKLTLVERLQQGRKRVKHDD